MRALLALTVLLGSTSVFAADVVGPESCKVCHTAAYQAWRETRHATAMTSLSPRQQKDARCISCHAPEQAKGLDGVTCESCHGGGQFYSPSYVMKDAELARAVGLVDPTEKMCLKCHDATAPSLKPFKFKEQLKLIDHWTVEREARKARGEEVKEAPAKKDRKEKP